MEESPNWQFGGGMQKLNWHELLRIWKQPTGNNHSNSVRKEKGKERRRKDRKREEERENGKERREKRGGKREGEERRKERRRKKRRGREKEGRGKLHFIQSTKRAYLSE